MEEQYKARNVEQRDMSSSMYSLHKREIARYERRKKLLNDTKEELVELSHVNFETVKNIVHFSMVSVLVIHNGMNCRPCRSLLVSWI